MCRAVSCTVCGKTTWAGCGQHVDQVKRTVPASNWCNGHSASEKASAPKPSGFFARLFGR